NSVSESTTTGRDFIQYWDGDDKIDVSALGIDAFSDFTITGTTGGDVTITSGSFSLVLDQVEVSTITASKFIFAGAPANQAPRVVTPIANQTPSFASALSYQFRSPAFPDPDGDSLPYSAALDSGSLPSWLSFSASTRTFTKAAAAGAAGTYHVVVTANDGH